MLVFIIPVKSKRIEKQWPTFCRLLDRCIGSICNQTNKDFKVIVACHEIPDTSFNDDPRISFLQVDFEPPAIDAEVMLKDIDKGKKIKLATERAINLGASYVMIVDSDDCVSNKISKFVNNDNSKSNTGWYIKKGYLYPEGKKYAYLNVTNFNEVCGTCVIIRPEYLDHIYKGEFWFYHDRKNFKSVPSLEPLPFAGAIYSMLNGSNILLDKKEIKKRTVVKTSKFVFFKTLLRRLKKYRIVPLVLIQKEFNLSKKI